MLQIIVLLFSSSFDCSVWLEFGVVFLLSIGSKFPTCSNKNYLHPQLL